MSPFRLYVTLEYIALRHAVSRIMNVFVLEYSMNSKSILCSRLDH